MSEHRLTRRVTTESKEVIKINRNGYTDKNLYTDALTSADMWVCDCGEGPFENEKAGIEHLKKNI